MQLRLLLCRHSTYHECSICHPAPDPRHRMPNVDNSSSRTNFHEASLIMANSDPAFVANMGRLGDADVGFMPNLEWMI